MNRLILLIFAATTFVSAFLLFQIQPLIAKAILPWFGGNSSVWTTCMLFFQVTLLLGYLYAHLVVTRLPPRLQGIFHGAMVLASLLFIAILPVRPNNLSTDSPVWIIFLLLFRTVGLPYFILSTTAPLIQAWFSQSSKESSPYWLYSLSNVGSLLGLLTYPFLFEPNLDLVHQSRFWSYGYGVFVLGITLLALSRLALAAPAIRSHSESIEDAPSLLHHILWFLLPCSGSVLLLSVTNHICQDVAVIPFLWIVPLSLYLITFILCFESDRWFSLRSSLPIYGVFMLFMSDPHLSGVKAHAAIAVTVSCAALFFGCMVCHGMAAEIKPNSRYLTRFHLLLSAGGAAGGIFVGLIAPLAFNGFYELPLAFVLTGFLALVGIWSSQLPQFQSQLVRGLCIATFIGISGLLIAQSWAGNRHAMKQTRNFFGVLRLTEEDSQRPDFRRLAQYHGKIMHGFQLEREDLSFIPTAYFSENSGIGRTLSILAELPHRKVGVIGLGVGALAVYTRAGDETRYYEINPDVVAQAENDFTYLKNSKDTHTIILGDGRLSLTQEEPQNFDVLIIDAFSGDSIPTHLVTAEAFALYLQHLKPNGIIAMNTTTPFDVPAVVHALAKQNGLHSGVVLNTAEGEPYGRKSRWIIATRNNEFWETLQAQGNIVPREQYQFPLVPWSDTFSNLFAILRW
ncbi:MAG: fused MFS/spermidine synthase [Bdellovibrionales bacterium]|nr:fused MFS/spermidine synthase [Bdellovibrionales bacterium]